MEAWRWGATGENPLALRTNHAIGVNTPKNTLCKTNMALFRAVFKGVLASYMMGLRKSISFEIWLFWDVLGIYLKFPG